MKVVVIGSGLSGTTTAYYLSRRGHEVTVVDRQEGPAQEASFANGALLTPSMSDPWNAPGSWRVLLSSLGKQDSAMQLRFHALPSLVGWGVQFLRNSRAAAFERNTQSNLRLALCSRELLEALRLEIRLSFDHASRGSLRLFRDAPSMQRASHAAESWRSEGLRFRSLSRTELVAAEPALAAIAGELVGGIHYEADEVGNAYSYCIGMREAAERQGVRFLFGTRVIAMPMRSGQLTEVVTERGCLAADMYVIAAGSYSAPLMQRLGVRLPVRPVKGYSITVRKSLEQPLSMPVIDDSLHAVVTPLANVIRVAGTAELAGFDTTMRPERIRNLIYILQRVLPHLEFDPADVNPWCGLRAMSADGVPIIGPTRIPNVFVNTGHGHLGWTMAAGSAHLLTALMCSETPRVDPAPFALSRFSRW